MTDATSSRSTDNISGHAQPLAGLHRPTSVAAVAALVVQARRDGTALYPVSTGLNFGYGGKSPVLPGCALVDLSGMNRILNAGAISLANPVAVIEPGVTQQQLYDYLQAHCPELTFNVTGSARATSILGNALDRGVGYFGPRKEDVFGLEVVCGSGKILQTGFRRLGEHSPLAHSHPYGAGPILDGLFFQGNFGIVTSACFRLVPRRPCQVALSLSLRDPAQLPQFIDQLAALKREGCVESVTHLGNQARTHATLMYGITAYLKEYGVAPERLLAEAQAVLITIAPGEWSSLGAVTGTAAQVKANMAEIRRRMKSLAKVTVVTEQKLARGYRLLHALRFWRPARARAAAIAAVRPLHGLALGVPTDAAIDNLLWLANAAHLPAEQLDQSSCGLLYINPALPLQGAFVAATIADLEALAQRHGQRLYMTLNIETATSMVAVINLLFDRTDSAATARAHACADALLERIRALGLEVYRARADMMAGMVAGQPDYWETVRALKTELDPDNIIAPGRYNLAR
ncbi:FAD-binding oxidoreductase [Massilia sp. PWRC2]|uniref:FAD-binding oxidoreductase n=1 Tax=Massilia sp. PWRC2 TaxID=2804626 RepID=UPI003CF7C6D6